MCGLHVVYRALVYGLCVVMFVLFECVCCFWLNVFECFARDLLYAVVWLMLLSLLCLRVFSVNVWIRVGCVFFVMFYGLCCVVFVAVEYVHVWV